MTDPWARPPKDLPPPERPFPKSAPASATESASVSVGAPPRELLKVVAAGDAARLQAAPGVGKRTAERIIVELREKVGATLPVDSITVSRSEDPVTLAREALLGLGYGAAEIDGLLEGAPGGSTEELIAHALRSARR